MTSVKLKDGPTLDADVVVVGAGVIPNTEFLAESGFPMERGGAVAVDDYMRVKGECAVSTARATAPPH